MGKKLFKQEQENYIIQNYLHLSDEELANELHVKSSQIHGWLSYKKLYRSTRTKFSESDKKIYHRALSNRFVQRYWKCFGIYCPTNSRLGK